MSLNEDEPSPRTFLDRIGFDPEESVLTQRQAEVFVLRERGYSQSSIADHLGTSRPNVANIEASARNNIQKAKETLRIVEATKAPVRISIAAGTDVYDVPDEVFAACDEADIKAAYSAPELMKRILDEAEDSVHGRTVEAPLTVSVSRDGELAIQRVNRSEE